MKRACKAGRQVVVWSIISRLAAGVVVILWLWRWFARLMPRAVGGEGVFAWSELAGRTYRMVERRNK